MATSNPVTKVLAIANKEIGYSRWKDPQRGTKYARETQPALWPNDKWLLANGIAFCDIFVTWVFWKAGYLNILPAKQSYNVNYRASKGGRVPKNSAQPGDVLVFDWNWDTLSANHVGILEKVLPSGNFQTIEGNTSPGDKGSQGNGGGVYRRTRKPSQVRYVIRPDWKALGGSQSAQNKPSATTTKKPDVRPSTSHGARRAPAFPLPRDKRGMFYYGPANGPRTSVSGRTRNTVVPHDVVQKGGHWYSKGLYLWQKRMQERGWNITPDGRYGDQTEKVTKQFQKLMNIKVDGYIGPTTYEKAWTSPVK